MSIPPTTTEAGEPSAGTVNRQAEDRVNEAPLAEPLGVSRIGLFRIGTALTLVQIATYVAMAASTNILLPVKIVDAVGEGGKNSWLGIVTSAGALLTMFTGPVIGHLSDKTRHRMGRRAPWMLVGAVAGAIGFLAFGVAQRPTGLLIAWALVQLGLGTVTLVTGTVLPERVPMSRRGLLSGATGLGTTLATAGAGFVGAAFVTRPSVGMLILSLILLVGVAAFIFLAPERAGHGHADPDHSDTSADQGDTEADRGGRPDRAGELPDDGRRPTRQHTTLRAYLSPFKHHNFRWMCAGRFLVLLGYQLVLTRQLYFVQAQLKLSLDAAATAVAATTGVAGILTVIALVGSGPLSDKFGRRPFVYGGGALVGLGMLLTTQVSTLAQMVAAWGVVSFGFGLFIGVDAALAADVLPEAAHVGKDLGIINLAQSLPQAAAPAIGSVLLAVGGNSYTMLLIVAAVLGLASIGATARLRGVR